MNAKTHKRSPMHQDNVKRRRRSRRRRRRRRRRVALSNRACPVRVTSWS
jgi:hypothetical protein